ncbi:Sf3a2-prov protein [Rhizobium paranaense]|uniref:Uncharacterized protein n=2 Tax=Rhizobium TaxID=379 RepID=A0A7W8XXA7_9HYPH|nr:Sf3a2-prov protein [Rhizobium paranaense]MBB5577246.1 hypothetical protein [Rhizobium paranaense]
MQTEHLAELPRFGMAPKLSDPMKERVTKPVNLKVSDGAAREAYERGGHAGMRETECEENPYPEGSKLAKAFEHGYLDGQKVQR